TTCALAWACSKRLLRPDMVGDLYACIPTLPCDASDDPVGACAAKLRSKYPPTAAQRAYEAAVQACPNGPSSCADGSCGGLSDTVYDDLTSCFQSKGDCDVATAFCVALTADLEAAAVCDASWPRDGGGGDSGANDGGAGDGG